MVSLCIIVAMACVHYFLLWKAKEYSSVLTSDLLDLTGSSLFGVDRGNLSYLITMGMFIVRGLVTLTLFGFLFYLVLKGEKGGA